VNWSTVAVTFRTHGTPRWWHRGVTSDHPTIREHQIDAVVNGAVGQTSHRRAAGRRELTDNSIVRHTTSHTQTQTNYSCFFINIGWSRIPALRSITLGLPKVNIRAFHSGVFLLITKRTTSSHYVWRSTSCSNTDRCTAKLQQQQMQTLLLPILMKFYHDVWTKHFWDICYEIKSSFKVTGNNMVGHSTHKFLLMFNSNYSSISHHFRYISTHL